MAGEALEVDGGLLEGLLLLRSPLYLALLLLGCTVWYSTSRHRTGAAAAASSQQRAGWGQPMLAMAPVRYRTCHNSRSSNVAAS